MYRLMLYYLIFLFVVAIILSTLGFLSFNPIFLLFSCVYILLVCYVANTLFAKIFKVPANFESFYITAFILVLIITPPSSFASGNFFSVALLASFVAMASKYLVKIKKKHIFNPAAFGVIISTLILGHSASWWVGNIAMTPFVILGGILMTRKLIRSHLVYSFILVTFLIMLVATFLDSPFSPTSFIKVFLSIPLLFFAFVMLTEPLTTPPRRNSQIAYGILVGILFTPTLHIFSVYSTPELALLLGNIFSYVVGSKVRLVLTLKEKKLLSGDVYDFVFTPDQKLHFEPGQYLEWTIKVKKGDSRGNRRYFTIASSPTESEIRIGAKFYDKPSAFKKELATLEVGDKMSASSLSGDFTLPKDKNKKLVFIAGGIGVTPYRSIIKFLTDKGEKRTVTHFFSNKTPKDIVYKDVFDLAERNLGIKTVYVVNDLAGEMQSSNMKVGLINEAMIREEVPDYKERQFYISGPHGMVSAFENTLQKMGVKDIKVDFFPGYV